MFALKIIIGVIAGLLITYSFLIAILTANEPESNLKSARIAFAIGLFLSLILLLLIKFT